MAREEYEAPDLSVELFLTDDVITVSDPNQDPDGAGWSPFVPL